MRRAGESVAAFEGTGDADGQVLRRAAEQDALPAALADAGLQDGTATCGRSTCQGSISRSTTWWGAPPAPDCPRRPWPRASKRWSGTTCSWTASSDLSSRDRTAGHVVALVTDPGRSASGGRGLLALTGPGIRTGVIQAGTAAEVTPTLLHLLGIPASRELPGPSADGPHRRVVQLARAHPSDRHLRLACPRAAAAGRDAARPVTCWTGFAASDTSGSDRSGVAPLDRRIGRAGVNRLKAKRPANRWADEVSLASPAGVPGVWPVAAGGGLILPSIEWGDHESENDARRGAVGGDCRHRGPRGRGRRGCR